MIRRHYRTCNDLNKKLLVAADDKPQTVREHVLNHTCHALNETINHKNIMFSFRVLSAYRFLFLLFFFVFAQVEILSKYFKHTRIMIRIKTLSQETCHRSLPVRRHGVIHSLSIFFSFSSALHGSGMKLLRVPGGLICK